MIIEGCIYDEQTGEIVSGGHIAVGGTATVNILDDGSDGCYRIDVITEGTVMIMLTPPFNYAFSTMCLPMSPEFDPTGGPMPPCRMMDPITCVLGVDPIGNELPDPSCASNPFARKFVIEDLDPQVINNHFPLQRLNLPAPVVSGAGYVLLIGLLLAVATLGLARQQPGWGVERRSQDRRSRRR